MSPAPLLHLPQPDTWERDLCAFYQQVSSWRAAAEKCGLTLPDAPDRTAPPDLSPQAKWTQAQVYWEELRSAWEQAAAANGVLRRPEGMF